MRRVDHGGAADDSDMRSMRNIKRVSFDEAHLKDKDKLDGRTIAVVRDNPMLARAFRRKRDEIIGSNYRMSCKPLWRMIPGFDEKYAREFGRMVSMLWQADVESTDMWLDARGQKTHTQILQQGLNTFKNTGEIFAVYPWREGIGEFATRVMTIDPGRVRTPTDLPKTNKENVVSGFSLSGDGYAWKAYIHDDLVHGSSRFDKKPGRKKKWKAILRKIDGGNRPQWVHIYDDEFPGCTRGRNSFSSALRFTNMLTTFQRNVLRTAAIQARHAAFLRSKFPEQAMAGLKSNAEIIEDALDSIEAFYPEEGVKVDGSVIGHLMPNDDLVEMRPNQPIDTFPEFESAMNRHLSAGADMGYSEYTGDYRAASYSTARQEDVKASYSNEALQGNIINKFADFNATNWMEEQCSNGRIPIRGLRTSRQRLQFFRKYKAFLANFCWHGTANKHIDPVKSVVAENIEINEIGTRLLSSSLNENHNMDLEDWAEEKSFERQLLIDSGLEHLIKDDNSTDDGSAQGGTGRINIAGQMAAQAVE